MRAYPTRVAAEAAGNAEPLEKRILLVEDEPTGREILAELLRGAGYVVDTVAGAGAAMLCLGSHSYALTISDWLLPDGSGVDVADTAMQRGAKTLIVSGLVFQLPAGAQLHHELVLKRLGPSAVVTAVRRLIGTPVLNQELLVGS